MASLASDNSLLIEFLTEELPPINLASNIGEAFSNAVSSQLSGFLTPESRLSVIAAPRRFGCRIENIKVETAAQQIDRKGPALATGLKDGVATKALLGFAKSCATNWESLEQRADGYFYFSTTRPGLALRAVIAEVINTALKKIPIAKAMRWGDSDYQFIRPVHNLCVLLNQEVLECEALGLHANASTRGHRFMSQGTLAVTSASAYFSQLEKEGHVVAEFAARRQLIEQQLNQRATELGLQISPSAGLLDEVSALVEWPEVLVGEFDAKFLAVPQECLILSMAKNQKYFALLDSAAKLTNRFLFVANIISKEPAVIIAGNQKVLSARLADAEFFYQFDQRSTLAEWVAKSANVVYHNKLGSQLERTLRLQSIAAQIAPLLGVDAALARQCAGLLKADLASEMVGEFPELQGVMGKYYALAAGESPELANAIEKHYYPRFSGDSLPASGLEQVVALADKLEILIGIWGIGLIPSGDKDPFALRRAALGIIRICLVADLDLRELLNITYQQFTSGVLAATAVGEVYEFILGRVANYFNSSEGYATKLVNAVISSSDLAYTSASAKKLNHLNSLFARLATFVADAANQPLLQANKRIENILKKNEAQLATTSAVVPQLLQEAPELELFRLFSQEFQSGKVLLEHKDAQLWDAYFADLARFNLALDAFFAEVMVMADDLQIRQNRLSLLQQLHQCFNSACLLSELA